MCHRVLLKRGVNAEIPTSKKEPNVFTRLVVCKGDGLHRSPDLQKNHSAPRVVNYEVEKDDLM